MFLRVNTFSFRFTFELAQRVCLSRRGGHQVGGIVIEAVSVQVKTVDFRVGQAQDFPVRADAMSVDAQHLIRSARAVILTRGPALPHVGVRAGPAVAARSRRRAFTPAAEVLSDPHNFSSDLSILDSITYLRFYPLSSQSYTQRIELIVFHEFGCKGFFG